MRQHGLGVRTARDTATMQSQADLPAIVIADLFGVGPGIAHRWPEFAGNGRSGHLAKHGATPAAAPSLSEG